jgi:hypothetical protein
VDIVKKESTQAARDKEELRKKKEKEKESIMQRMLPVLPIVFNNNLCMNIRSQSIL